ncbi:MAG: radical SAM protein [Solidesulfovibrio sp. DCME]|uniref:tetratricopeptide repeat protein n=1 Tax=Solidesulfovibrio sp. DCME TaxID=3447380 RepID=UPI003D0FB723
MVWQLEWIEVHAVDHCNNCCRWCNNHSVFSAAKEYEAKDYFVWLDELIKRKIVFHTLSVMGGEPFLHSNITKFVYELKNRYNKITIITTNGFWLSDSEIVKYQPLFCMLHDLKITLYPNIVKSLGGMEKIHRLLDRLHAQHPHLNVRPLPIENVFRRMDFVDSPLEVDKHCFNAECTCLLADGRMGRCGPGAFAHLHPNIPEPFRNSKDMFYDLKTSRDDFWHWRMRWPLDACRYCNHFRSIRSPWKVEKGHVRQREYELKYFTDSAYQLLAREQYKEAEATCLNILEHYSGTKEVYNCLGILSYKNRQPQAAIHFFNKALHLDPMYEPARKNMESLTGSQG